MNANRRTRTVALVVVLAHLLVASLHGYAHTSLGVGLTTWQNLYVLIVITLAPLVAAASLWTRYVRLGFWLLAASMFASLIFGVYYHYVEISNDHVSHLPTGSAQWLFKVTALLLVLTELSGAMVAVFGLRTHPRQTVS